ncbi:MAG: hypothetical protein II152_02730 [Succinivibrionaceae bacterium]|nr:hypothetical protein [Succinivibrionaceae bacterium]
MITKGKILTFGNINDFYPLGADNKAAYEFASVFLKNLDRKDKSLTKYFAVSETNRAGSRIDWYCNGSYYNGDPQWTPWREAQESERTAALAELDQMTAGLAKLAERLRDRPDQSPDLKFFLELISGDKEKGTPPIVLQTPGRDWIFIVDGHPVLTFWGFTEKGIETAGADPFYFLRPPKHAEPAPAAPQPEPAPAPEPAPEQAPAPSPEPAAGAAGAASAAGAGTAAAAGSEKVTGERTVEKKSFWAMIPAWLWWLLLFLLLLLLLLLLWFYLLKPRFFPDLGDVRLPQITAPLQGDRDSGAAVTGKDENEPAGGLNEVNAAPDERHDGDRTDLINVQPGSAADRDTVVSATASAHGDSAAPLTAAGTSDSSANADASADLTQGTPASAGNEPAVNPDAVPDESQTVNPDSVSDANQAVNPDAVPGTDQTANPDAAPAADQSANPDAVPDSNAAAGTSPDAAAAPAGSGPAAGQAAPGAAADAATGSTAQSPASGRADQAAGPVSPVRPLARPMKASALRNSVMTRGSELSASSGLRDEKHGQPVKMSFKWNGDGTGEEIIRQIDGTECRGPVSTSGTGGSVSISPSGSIKCSDGSSFRAQKIDCHEDSSGNSRCAMSGNGGRSVPVVLSDGNKQGAGK